MKKIICCLKEVKYFGADKKENSTAKKTFSDDDEDSMSKFFVSYEPDTVVFKGLISSITSKLPNILKSANYVNEKTQEIGHVSLKYYNDEISDWFAVSDLESFKESQGLPSREYAI